jgi:hypothetical protein
MVQYRQHNGRIEIVDAMLSSTPAEIPVQLRYVELKTKMYGSSQLTEASAYQNTPNARLGFFNDAFLNNYGDMGTYSSDECENPVGTSAYNYLSNETNYLPMTGETNGLNPCNGGFRTAGQNAIYEMGLGNWTTLNRDYYEGFWDQINANDYGEILKKLGYRFVLNSSSVSVNGSSFNLTLNITNVGFARPFKQRNVYLVMRNTSTNSITTHLINTDIRTWETSVSVSQDFNLAVSGTFQLYLWMPDKDTLLAENSDYSIQFANTGTWDAETGYNNLLQTVNLSTVGVSDFSDLNEIKISPNPTSDNIKIQFNSEEKINLQIYNSAGGLVKEASVSNNQVIDVSDLPYGTYFIHFDNQLPTCKFIKQ